METLVTYYFSNVYNLNNQYVKQRFVLQKIKLKKIKVSFLINILIAVDNLTYLPIDNFKPTLNWKNWIVFIDVYT